MEYSLDRVKGFKKKKGAAVFRLSAFVGVIGLIGSLCSAGAAVYIVFDSSQLVGGIILSAMFGVLSIPLMIFYLVTKLYLYPDRIVYRSMFGIKRQISWKDVKSAYIASHMGDIRVCSEYCSIPVWSAFKRFDIIKGVLKTRCPKAFQLDSVISGPAKQSKEFKTINGMTMFRMKAVFLILGAIFALMGAVPAFFPGYELLAAFMVPLGVLFTLPYFIIRLYINNDEIVYRNILGRKTRLLWKDVSAKFGTENAGDLFFPSYVKYIKLYNTDNKIKITESFEGFDVIKDLVCKYCRNVLWTND